MSSCISDAVCKSSINTAPLYILSFKLFSPHADKITQIGRIFFPGFFPLYVVILCKRLALDDKAFEKYLSNNSISLLIFFIASTTFYFVLQVDRKLHQYPHHGFVLV